jgi:hypothetical protein
MKLPKTLIEHLSLRRCVPWCGAGISVASNLPTWPALITQFIDACEDGGMPNDAIREIQSLGAEDAVEVCRDFLGENEYRNFLERVLGVGAPNPLHEKIVKLPVPAILTTNFDRLIETAIAKQTGGIPRVLTADDTKSLWKAIAKEEFFLLKVNGDIARPSTVVLTSRDYTRHVFGNPTFMAVVQRIILGYSILFIGSSVSDVYLRRILEETTFMTGQTGMAHFALMPGVGPVRAKLLRDRYNINVIPYELKDGDHAAALGAILDQLAMITANFSS